MTRYGVVGRGRAARSLVPLMVAGGGELSFWWSRGDPDPPTSLPPADVVVLAVPDAAIEAVAERLAERPHARAETWLHLSGARPGEVGRVSPTIPAHAGCMHPLVALTGADPPAHLAGATAGVDGEPRAVVAAEVLARLVGLSPLTLSPSSKPLYHAAAVTVAGHAVALFDQATRMLIACGLPPDAARAALQPLMAGAIENLAARSPAAAITGPLSRGDAATVASHVAALATLDDTDLLAVYRALGRAALRISRDALAPQVRDQLTACLAAAPDRSPPGDQDA